MVLLKAEKVREKMKLKKIICAASALATFLGTGGINFPVSAAEDGLINVLSCENADFKMKTSLGEKDGEGALDGDIISTAEVGGFDGEKIFDVNGNSGSDYMLLFTVNTNAPVPMERIKLYYDFGIAYIGGAYYNNGESMYEGKPTTPWFEGVEVFTSDTGEKGSWKKAAEFESLENMRQEETRPEEIWDDSNGIRYFYDLPLDNKVTAKYLRIAVRDMKPWLGGIVISEFEIKASPEDVPAGYKKINVESSDRAEMKVTGSDAIGKGLYGKAGSEYTLTVTPDSVSKINSVKINGSEIEGTDGVYKFTMPGESVTISADCSIADSEDVPLKMESAEIAGGEIVKTEVVPVVTFTFNNAVGKLDKSKILVNGKKDTGLIQHAFVDALDDKKVHVVPFGDKLVADTEYTITVSDEVLSLAGKKQEKAASATFKTAADYTGEHLVKLRSYITGYEDGTFRPDNNITVNEALLMAGRIGKDKDFSFLAASDEPAKRIDIARLAYVIKYGENSTSSEDSLAKLVEDGIVKGYEDGSLRGESKVTRAEAVALFNRAAGTSLENSKGLYKGNFSDVSEDFWAASDIAVASESDEVRKITWTENIPEIEEYDVFNKKNDIWTQIPCVTAEQRAMGMAGGEGGQWMQAIECDKEDGTLLFAGVDVSGVLRSTDGGQSWTRVNRGWLAGGCVDLAIDPNNRNRVLGIGSVSDNSCTGIYFTDDMGDNWTQVHSYIFNGQRDTREQLAWDKSSYDEEIGGSRIAYWSNLYKLSAGLEGSDFDKVTHFSDRIGGLFRSDDGGKTWNLINSEMSDSVIAVHPKTGRLYLGNERGFFISDDHGVSFKQILSGRPIYGLSIIDTRPDNVYINDYEGVLISENCGETFTRQENNDFPVRTDVSDVRNIVRDLAVSPANPDYMMVDDRNYLKYDNRRYFSHDGGKTWAESGYDKSKDFFFCHSRQHPYAWHPTDENKVWTLGGDWITSSNDGGENFIWDANGVCGIPPGGRVNFDPYEPNRIFAGAQDLLGCLSYDGGYTWKAIVPEGGGFGCAYGTVSVDDLTLVSANADGWYSGRSIWTSFDGGDTWNNTGLALKYGAARRATSFWRSPRDPDTVFAGEYVSRDRCKTWTELSGCELVLAVNYYHNRELWGINKEVIVCSYDDGKTWYPFANPKIDDEPARSDVTSVWTYGSGIHIWDMEYDGINDILYYLPGNIYSGVTIVRIDPDNEQKNLGGGINPQCFMNDKWYQIIALDPRHPDVIYMGGYGTSGNLSTASVQRSCDRGETWQIIASMGDEKSIVKDGPSAGVGPQTIVVNPENGEVFIWDGGQGFWKFPAPYTEKK